MRAEIFNLSVMSLFFLFAWVPASIGKGKSFGMKWVLSNRESDSGKELPSWAARFERAHNNLKEFFPAFIVAILLLAQFEKFDQQTAIASYSYVIGRLGHFITYGMGIATLRPIFFFMAFFANIFLLIKLFI